MTLGIWTTDESLENQKKLFDAGFRGATIGDPYKDISWQEVAEKMYNERYLPLKEIGYTHFLLQMYSASSEYHDAVIEKFKDCQGVEYLFGEPWDFVERNGWKESALLFFLRDLSWKIFNRTSHSGYSSTEEYDYAGRYLKCYNDLLTDIQLRLWNKLDNTWSKIPSSYFWQQRVWYKDMPFIWIYGQLAWHSFIPFIGSSSYKRLKKKADELGIKVAYLYQGDGGKFTNLLNNFLQKRFIKIFGGKNV